MKSILRSLVYRLLLRLADKQLPPATDKEISAIKILQDKFKILINNYLPVNVNESWHSNSERLANLVLQDDVRSFLRWEVIQKTMFVGNSAFIHEELKYLQKSRVWKSRWSKAVVEDYIGHPIPLVGYPRSSGNLIHHAYHLAVFEYNFGMFVQNLDFVLEFGGGYGSMCRLFHKLGFQGQYIIVDLPPFTALQEFYLTSIGLPIVDNPSNLTAKKVICISDLCKLKNVLNKYEKINFQKSLFLATWSLSETPIEVRDEVVSLIDRFNYFLIAYGPSFCGIDNVDYFKKFIGAFPNVSWDNFEIHHMPGQRYLMGNKTNQ